MHSGFLCCRSQMVGDKRGRVERFSPLGFHRRKYDNNGNALTSVTGSDPTSYSWDFENRLASVTLPGTGGTVSFAYDPFGRRIKKVSSTTTSIFAYDGDNLVEETNSSGAAVA